MAVSRSLARLALVGIAGSAGYASVRVGVWSDGRDSRDKLDLVGQMFRREIDYSTSGQARLPKDVKKYISKVSVAGTTDSTMGAERDGLLVWMAGWWNRGVHNTVQFLAGQSQDGRTEHRSKTMNKLKDIANSGYEKLKQWMK